MTKQPKTPTKRELTRLARAAGASRWAEIEEHGETTLIAYGGNRFYIDVTGANKHTRRRALAAALREMAGEET